DVLAAGPKGGRNGSPKGPRKLCVDGLLRGCRVCRLCLLSVALPSSRPSPVERVGIGKQLKQEMKWRLLTPPCGGNQPVVFWHSAGRENNENKWKSTCSLKIFRARCRFGFRSSYCHVLTTRSLASIVVP
ncbi:unnamed protein product, partial [Hapterophycus canaliculatus]